MRGLRDAARAARERALRHERQALARAEAAAVAEGVAETVALSRARGAAIDAPAAAAGARLTPYRRRSGLEWLAGKGRIDAAARAAGERYGEVYRSAKREAALPSTLAVQPGRTVRRAEVPLELVKARGEATAVAQRRLAALRQRLFRQPDLVGACDLVCGEELTPREAAGGERDAGRLEAVLKVALDILATEGG